MCEAALCSANKPGSQRLLGMAQARASTSTAPSPGSGKELSPQGSPGDMERRGREQPGPMDCTHPHRSCQKARGKCSWNFLSFPRNAITGTPFGLGWFSQAVPCSVFSFHAGTSLLSEMWLSGPGLGGHSVLWEGFLYQGLNLCRCLGRCHRQFATCPPRDNQSGCQAELPGWLQEKIKSN